jgi:Ca2+-binding EF-hand superfamily protein
MKISVSGGVVLAVLFSAAPALSQTASPASLTTPSSHARRSFFNSNQNRSDVAAHVQRMFKHLDLNGDGFITKEEIATSQAQFDQKMSKNAPKRAAKMFDRLDTNHDGQITQSDVDAARAARLAKNGKQPRPGRRGTSSLFAKADADKDGIVTRAEFDAATASGKIKVRHSNMRGSAIVRLFDLADVNKDGRVSLEEAQTAALQHFDAADLNHDGVLTPDERRQASKGSRAKKRMAA